MPAKGWRKIKGKWVRVLMDKAPRPISDSPVRFVSDSDISIILAALTRIEAHLVSILELVRKQPVINVYPGYQYPTMWYSGVPVGTGGTSADPNTREGEVKCQG